MLEEAVDFGQTFKKMTQNLFWIKTIFDHKHKLEQDFRKFTGKNKAIC